jgi:hypothetical protein
MSPILFAVILAATPVTQGDAVTIEAPVAVMARSLAGDVQTGTLIFSEGDCLAVRVYSGSPYTHVAAIIVDDGEPIVYDSMNGAGVRRQTLAAYLEAQQPDVIHVLRPRREFSDEQTQLFKAHLVSQLGRPYAVKHHLTGNRAEGVHCAEYVTDALQACRLIQAKQPPRVSPASLAEGILRANLYLPPQSIKLTAADVEPPRGDTWWKQLWFDTKQCTLACCSKLRGWILCK